MDKPGREVVRLQNSDAGEVSSSGFRLVPWQSWDEWKMVREKLFSSSPESVGVALNRIKTWESRGCLPIPVAITAEIAEARLTDPYFRMDVPNSGLNSEKMLSLLYSMAIMRLVNGFVDQSQDYKKNKKKLSIAKAADEIGLPRMLIDIRHESSHRGLPSLPLLHLAIDKALNWLRTYYWERQVKAIPDILKSINSSLSKMAQCIKEGHAKKEVMKTSRTITLAYLSYPMEVASLLLEKCLWCKSGLSDSSEAISSVNSVAAASKDDMFDLVDLDVWKLVIRKLSRKRTDLLLAMFEASLVKIDDFSSQNSQDDVKCALIMPFQKQNHKVIENIVSMASWLLECLKEIVYHDSRTAGCNCVRDTVLRDRLESLLRICLGKLARINSLSASCLILADLVGKGYLTESIRKLAEMRQPNQNLIGAIDRESGSEQEEASLSEAVKKLELLKKLRPRIKIDIIDKENAVWTVAKSWKPCPIGTLPSLSSGGGRPVLEVSNVSEGSETMRMRCKRNANYGMVPIEPQCNKRMRESSEVNLTETLVNAETNAVVLDGSGLHESQMVFATAGDCSQESSSPLEGKLLIDGSLQHCGPDMLCIIQSKVRIFDSLPSHLSA